MSGSSRKRVVSDVERMVCEGMGLEVEADDRTYCMRVGAVADGSAVIFLGCLCYVRIVAREVTDCVWNLVWLA